MTIVGIPTTRVSDSFALQRLLNQVQLDQDALLRLETQLSTGHRLELPSDDPTSALEIIGLQRLLERKEQVKTNLTTNQSYLTASDTAISQISSILAEVRSVAMGAMGTVVTDQQRAAAAQQVAHAVEQLLDVGNQKFRGRYLFAGSTTGQRPFEIEPSGFVRYAGNEGYLYSYGDVDVLFETNVPGSELFGAVSDPVRGSVDLDPVLSFDTRVADLRGGQGVSLGSIAISDGSQTSVIDLSGAETIGDVAALIQANPPEGRSLTVEVTTTGLVIQLDAAPGNLSIREADGGTTAAELGILAPTGVGNDPVVGSDLDPILRPTTPLADLLGARARAVVHVPGVDNDFILEADTRGPQYNDVTVTLVDDPAVGPGNEVVLYDAVAKTIEIRIAPDGTRARHVIDAVNAAYQLGTLPFTARMDPLDDDRGGLGFVTPTPPGETAAVTAGGRGSEPDLASGLQITNGGQTYVVELADAETVEDLLNRINGTGAGVSAAINQTGTGIDVRSRLSGSDFAIGENGGTTATELGLRTFTSETPLADLNFGRGVEDYQGGDSGGIDFTITRSDGVSFDIDLDGTETIGDVLELINTHPDNLAGGTPLVARLATYGNGIELVDDSGGPGQLVVTRAPTSSAAVHLGLVPEGEDSAQVAGPGTKILTGRDVHPLETEGVFTALLRLQSALANNDLDEMERAIQMLDERVAQLNLAWAELGVRQQGLDALQTRLDNEEVELQSVLSLEYDADIVQVVSELSARQLALQAGLQATARILNLTLLDYL
ncbi:MAG TPA: flagellar hook-associated protein 3 [Planctomycetes bacterium]|nr:flagellar hook-associated protein 3 [Planctomycetota bacterium]